MQAVGVIGVHTLFLVIAVSQSRLRPTEHFSRPSTTLLNYTAQQSMSYSVSAMVQLFLAIAAVFGGLSVAGGAFAAHALRNTLSDRALEVFETGARYQMYHALALLLVALLLSRAESAQALITTSGVAFIIGVVIFSGSLYALSLSGIKWLGAIAPLGGLSFIVGWACLAIAAVYLK